MTHLPAAPAQRARRQSRAGTAIARPTAAPRRSPALTPEAAGQALLRLSHEVRGRALDCGHYLPEEAPEATYAELHAFFAG